MSNLIPPADLKVEYYDPHPPGGQQVRISYGVKVTHVDSGLVAIVTSDRSQHRNKEIAVHMIEAALTHPKFRY